MSVKVIIDNKEVEVPKDITIIQACEMADVEIPRFCYHERLKIAGNCRMCLVELEGGPPKPIASCAMNVSEGMKIKTDSPMVKKAREGAMEFLLANHPLDCPICDQGGECDLQDQSYIYGKDHSEFSEDKRAVKDKNMGPLIKTHMTRCIHCTRCVRFITDIAGTAELGAINRGEDVEITTYIDKSLTSELSGNIIDLCPVGALTSKPYAFKARSWELKKTNSIDIMDATGSNIRIDSRGNEVMRILPRINEQINEEWISDKTRFCYDALKYQRLDKYYIKKDGKLTAATKDEALNIIKDKFSQLKAEEISALSGNLSGIYEIFALKKLMAKIGSDNIDCRGQNSVLNSSDRASYIFNSGIENIEEADSCLIIGSNIRKTSPIINARIRKKYLTGQLKIAAIGVDADLTYKYNNLGDNISILKDILSGDNEYTKILKSSKKPMIIIGEEVLNGKSGQNILSLAKEVAKKYNFIQENWNGFNILHDNASLTGALDLGFISKNSKIHKKTILDNCKKGKIKALYLLAEDNIDFTDLSETFIIYQGSFGENGAHNADIIIPAPSFAEKDNLFVNIEGRIQNSNSAIFAIDGVENEENAIVDLANKLNLDLGFTDDRSLRAALLQENPNFANIDEVFANNWQENQDFNIEDIKDGKISAQKDNFFTSNVVARNSKILSDCNKVENNK
ncbi:NADH-quinone oxidoreductase subunit NuoG [Rickettsiales bacterium]|nr:NADH-quinone oxidoreductase subunit NuoG [Rickettsiales bacterium]MDB2550813.1 NADH-quinone oxidoreductase subunit NuoG [Rickettsiales bacterium]